MKIAIYTPTWPPGHTPNGIVTYCGHLVGALREIGHEVYVVCGQLDDKVDDPYVIPIKLKINFFYAKLIRLWDKFSPGYAQYMFGALAIKNTIFDLHYRVNLDVIEMEESFGWCGVVANELDIPVVVKLHGPHFLVAPPNYINNIPGRIDILRIKREGLALRSMKFITAPSASVLNSSKAYHGLRPVLNEVIRNPTARVDSDDCWDVDLCDKNLILFVGRFDKVKGGDLVVKAFSKLAERNQNLKLIFVGPDTGIPDDTGVSLKFYEYIQKIMPPSILKRVKFMGKLNADEISGLRLKAFLTLLPSRMDNFPNTMLEAMSYGCPLVTTSVGGIKEVAIDNVNAIVVQPDCVASLVDAVQRVLEQVEYAQGLGRAARRTVLDKFLSENIAKQAVDFYYTAIESSK